MVQMLSRTKTVQELADEIALKYLDWEEADSEESIYGMPLNPSITASVEEINTAIFWRGHARGTTGIFGSPGSGKTLLLTAIAILLNHLFFRPVVMDYYPKQAFIDQVGEDNFTYIDEDTLLRDMQEIDKLARDKDWSPTDKAEWVIDGKGSSGVKLHGSTFLIAEMDRWVNCRRTGTRINDLIQALFKQWRHYDIGIFGDCVDQNDLDRQRIRGRFSTTVFCNPLENDIFQYLFSSVEQLTKGGVRHIAKKERLTLNGRDFYKFYWTRNPIALAPKLRLREPKQRVVVDKETGEILKEDVVK